SPSIATRTLRGWPKWASPHRGYARSKLAIPLAAFAARVVCAARKDRAARSPTETRSAVSTGPRSFVLARSWPCLQPNKRFSQCRDVPAGKPLGQLLLVLHDEDTIFRRTC